MKSILFCVAMVWMFKTEAQTANERVISNQYPSTNISAPEPSDSVLSTGISNNPCNNLQAGFTHYGSHALTVQFTDNSFVLDGSISGYSWHFGDRSSTSDSSNAENPSYNYTSAGTDTVCLTVYENVQGGPTCQDSTCQVVTVTYVAGGNSGVQDLGDNTVDIYPNPSTGYLIMRASIPVESYMVGEKLDEQKSIGDVIHLPPTLMNGIYFINFKTQAGTLIKKLLLQYQ